MLIGCGVSMYCNKQDILITIKLGQLPVQKSTIEILGV